MGAARSALWFDCACVPLPTISFQLPALLEGWDPLLSYWGAALLCWGLGLVLLLHVRMWSGEAGTRFTFWDSCLLMGLPTAWSFVLEPAAEVWAHLWAGWGYSRTSSVNLLQDLTPGSVEEAEEAEPDEEFKDAIEV